MDARFAAVTETFPQDIVSGEGRERLLDCAQQLPRCALDSTFGFESHLGEPTPYCDLFVSAKPGSPFSRVLAEQGSNPGVGAMRQGLSRVARELDNSESFLSAWGRSIVLEYDVVVAPWSAARSPGVFVGRNEGDAEPDQQARLLANFCSWMFGREEESQHQNAIALVLRALPRGSRVLHAGAMPDRAADVLRLVVKLQGTEIGECLRRLEWGGSWQGLRRLMELVRDWRGTKSVGLSLDVSKQGVCERLGLDLYLPQPWHSTPAQSWSPCLQRLVEAGWCCREKAAGLLSWPRSDMILSESETFKLLTGINHLKLILEAGEVRSKAYMGAFLFKQSSGTPLP